MRRIYSIVMAAVAATSSFFGLDRRAGSQGPTGPVGRVAFGVSAARYPVHGRSHAQRGGKRQASQSSRARRRKASSARKLRKA